MRSVALAQSLWVLATLPAWAEVCDKERPNWSSTDGAVGMMGEAIAVLSSPVSVFALVTVAVGLWSGARVLCVTGGVLTGLILFGTGFEVGVALQLFAPDLNSSVYYASVKEGCRANPILAAFLCAILTLACALRMTVWRPRRVA